METTTNWSKQPKNTSISPSVAISNYTLIRKGIPAGTKLCVDKETGKFSLDNRWGYSMRRYMTGDSRDDLDVPMRETFVLLLKESIVPITELQETLDITKQSLIDTYGEDNHLIAYFKSLQMEIDTLAGRSATTPEKVSPRHSPGLSSGVVRLRIGCDQTPDDVRIDMSQVKNVDDFEHHQYEDNEKSGASCKLYQWFPCLRKLIAWFSCA